ncbi:MAG TPA: Pycsar system effector family protein [Saprospiraceae bacterium]|nr:Pycsar system effector family protein [Saprospiraceae bacterium]
MEEQAYIEDSGVDVQRGLLLDVTARNQMELIAIADNKANAITTICILLIVLIIVAFSSGFEVNDVPLITQIQFVLPLAVLLVFCAIAAICAILALKPKIIRSTKKQHRGMLFFHNYYRKSLKDYMEEMRSVMRTKDSIYDQMMTNIYYNGLVLERKYALLGIAYTVFLLAIVCSVSSYVIASVI